MTEFLSQYGAEEQCRCALFEWRWPEGFVCPSCGHTGHCEIAGRGVYQCYRCHHQTSVISGTIFESTKLPLTTWFLGLYLLTQPKNGTFTWVNTMIGNVKNSLYGSYHAISDAHLPRYLAEFCYRFNRRFKLEDMIPRLGYAAVRTPPMP